MTFKIGENLRLDSIGKAYEFPALSQNPNITNIFTKLFEEGGY